MENFFDKLNRKANLLNTIVIIVTILAIIFSLNYKIVVYGLVGIVAVIFIYIIILKLHNFLSFLFHHFIIDFFYMKGKNYYNKYIYKSNIDFEFETNIRTVNDSNKIDKVFEDYEKKLYYIYKENPEPEDIITHMLKDTGETTDYFKICKSEAQKSFSMAIIFSVLGILLIIFAFVWVIVSRNITPTIISLTGGGVTEMIAGTAIVIRKQSLAQLNYYFKKLNRNQDILLSLKMVERMSKDKQDDMLQEIIKTILK